MTLTAAKDVKVEQKEPAPGVSASTRAAAPATGAAVSGGSTGPRTEDNSDQPEATTEPLPASQLPPPAPPLYWRPIVQHQERLTWKRENAIRNPWRSSHLEELTKGLRRWQPMDVPSSEDANAVTCEYRVDVSWGALIPIDQVAQCVGEMVAFCRTKTNEVLPRTVA